MADQGEEQEKGEASRKKKPGKRRRRPGKQARKEELARRRLQLRVGQRRFIQIFAIAHPMRRNILRFYVKEGRLLSPTQVAKQLDQPVSIVMYHVAVLHRVGALEPADGQAADAATEHPYDAVTEGDPPIKTLLEETSETDLEDIEKGQEE